jgi:hypothetical protein
LGYEAVVGEGQVEVDLEAESTEEGEPTQAEKEAAVREFVEWAHAEAAAFLDLEAIDQDVAEAEASGDWDAIFNNAAYAVQQMEAMMEQAAGDPLALLLEAISGAQVPDEASVISLS